MKKLSWLLAPLFALTLWMQPALAQKSSDSIWVIGSPSKSGDSFSAGWTSRASYPWALAQCRDDTGTFWGEYRALQADGTIGVFDLVSADPNFTWPSTGGTCDVSLVVKGKVTATSPTFIVGP